MFLSFLYFQREHDIHLQALAELHRKVKPLPGLYIGMLSERIKIVFFFFCFIDFSEGANVFEIVIIVYCGSH